MNIWSSPFIFFHRKRIKTPALSQHIHCYCCSALRNAYNKISLFRVSDSCLQWSDYSLSVRICLKISSLGLVGGGNCLLLKVVIILYGCSVHAFCMLRVCHFGGTGGALVPHALCCAFPPVRAPGCTWGVTLVLCCTLLLLLLVAQRVLEWASPDTALTGSQGSPDLQGMATQPLPCWASEVWLFWPQSSDKIFITF